MVVSYGIFIKVIVQNGVISNSQYRILLVLIKSYILLLVISGRTST